jgi:hypothetical protein
MAFLVLGANSVSGYTVKNSLRFNSGSTDYLNRTQGTPTSNQKFTVSAWYKRTNLATNGDIWSIGANGDTEYVNLKFDSSDKLIVVLNDISSYYLFSSSLYRDVSAWYHVMLAVDTTQATASNRARVYINGSEVTSWGTSTYPTQNYTFPSLASGKSMFIGRRVADNGELLNGYLADYYFIDGQQLTPSSFGETDTDTGIWKPKAYTGTYGTNGFYLKFANSASLGTDSSGNGNTFTVNNLTSVDQSTDTPTNNFCTLNNLDGGTNGTFTEGNLQLATSSAGYSTTRASFGVSAGKWYWEAKLSSGTAADIGINTSSTDIANTNQFLGYPSTGYAYSTSGNKATNNTNTAYGSSYTTNDIIGVAFDADNGTLVFYKNGTTQGTAFTGLTGNTYHPAVSDDSGSSACTWQMNFGSPPYSANSYTDGAGKGNFSYSVPSGYFALCTANLSLYG